MRDLATLLAVVLVCVAACGGDDSTVTVEPEPAEAVVTPEPTATPVPTVPPDPSVTPAPTAEAVPSATAVPTPTVEPAHETFSVMTYNIKCCLDPDEQQQRFADLVQFLEEASPDILGVQEAGGWSDDDLGVATRLAAELGYSYALGESEQGDLDTALFSRFEIVEEQNYPDVFSRNTMRAAVRLPNGEVVHVIVTHLAVEMVPRPAEVEALVQAAAPYGEGLALVIGDFNFRKDRDGVAEKLGEAGYQEVSDLMGFSPDLIFATRDVGVIDDDGNRYVEPGWFPPQSRDDLSDHTPTIVTFGLR